MNKTNPKPVDRRAAKAKPAVATTKVAPPPREPVKPKKAPLYQPVPTRYTAYDAPAAGEIPVEIDILTWQKLRSYILGCDTEINGLGFVRLLDEGTRIVIDDVFLMKQVVDPGSATFDPEYYCRFLSKLGKYNDERKKNGKSQIWARFQWHSHVEMAARFSTDDNRVIKNCTSEWMLWMVMNKFGEFSMELHVYKPFRHQLKTKLQVIFPGPSIEMQEACAEDTQRLVRVLPPKIPAAGPVPYYGGENPSYMPSYYGCGGAYGDGGYAPTVGNPAPVKTPAPTSGGVILTKDSPAPTGGGIIIPVTDGKEVAKDDNVANGAVIGGSPEKGDGFID